MPEETQEQVVEESQVEEAQVEETETPETTEETVEPDPLAEKWQKVAPDIADAVGNLTPEERVGILLNRLAAQPAGAPPEGSDATAATPDGQKPQTPLAAEIPNLDPDALVAGFQEAVETNNGEQAGKLMGQALEWMRALGGVMSGAINENQDEMGKMRGLLTDATQPAEFRNAVPDVRSATEADIPAARTKLASGEAGTIEAALKLAVSDRDSELARATRTPGDDATRRAKGIGASRQAGPSRRAGEVKERIPVNSNEMAALMRKEEAAKKH